ncbi:MAG: hypothetical protein HJJLKODD_03018 [Phycisphaerae bacterium]|nr:hypothetical protein [Phycisphaerae bacterium]
MPRTRRNFRLGLTVILMFALLVWCVIFIGGRNWNTSKQTTLLVRFAAGVPLPELGDGSFVTYFGQKVGKVVATHFINGQDPRQPEIQEVQFLEVRATVPADLDLREDCVVVASGPPLGGKGNIDILKRGVSAKRISSDQPVYGETSGFQAVLNQLSRELDENNASGLLSRIKVQLDPVAADSLLAKIHKTVDNLQSMTASLDRELNYDNDAFIRQLRQALAKVDTSLEEINLLLKDNRPKLNNTFTSIEQASSRIDTQIVTPLAAEFQMAESPVLPLMSKIHLAMDNLNWTLADLSVTSDEIKNVVVLNSDRISEIIQNATEASDHLKQGIIELKLQPWKALFPPTDAVKGQLLLMNVAREYADAATRLDDSSTRLQALLESNGGYLPAAHPELLKLTSELQAVSVRFFEAEKALYKQLQPGG